jgi:hypothetical protein
MVVRGDRGVSVRKERWLGGSEPPLRGKVATQGSQEKPLPSPSRKGWRGASVTVPETATGGRGEYPQARGITPAKELCKMSP